MSLWTNNEYGQTVEIVKPDSDAWKVFKEILTLKVKNGDGTKENISDFKYMNEYDKKNGKR